jgi:septal ring factor EnvC (AmiA/AmiB activator)
MKAKTTEQLERQIRLLKRTNQAQQKEIKGLEQDMRTLEIELAESQRDRDRLRREVKKLEVAVDVAESREEKRLGLI